MKETIYTIPINESFDHYDGCPLCRLQRDLEQKSLDYVMGAAMMEPDVRIETNAAGFCQEHFSAMLQMKNRLSLALILQSHLKEVAAQIEKPLPAGSFVGKKSDPVETLAHRCFVCERVNGFMEKYVNNILYLYQTEPSFREKLEKQPYFCLPHLAALRGGAGRELKGKERGAFLSSLNQVEHQYLQQLQEDMDTFCKSFDYRFTDLDLTRAKTCCERSAGFLAGEVPDHL